METDMETETDMDMELGNFCQVFHYGTIVPIALYGMPLKYHGAISNGAIYLQHPSFMKTMT